MGLGINIGKIGSGINVRTYYNDIEPWNICQNIDLTLEYVFQQYLSTGTEIIKINWAFKNKYWVLEF